MKPVNTKLRSINTKFWDDSYIIELSPLEKYLFLYLLTNSSTNLAGVYEITLKKIAFDTGLEKKEIEKIFKKLSEDKKIIYKDGYLIIKNFLKNQSLNKNMINNVDKTIAQLPKEIKEIYNHFVNPSEALETLSKDSKAFETLRKTENENEIENEVENKIEREGERGKEKENKENEGTFIDEELKKTLKQIGNKYNKPFARPVN